MANFINGELFGRVTQVPWAVQFPTELLHEDYIRQGGQPIDLPPNLQHSPEIVSFFQENRGGVDELRTILHPRHPSQIYEALGEGLFMSLILIWLRLKFPRMPNGVLSGLFFLLYALVRIALENVRQPDSGAEMIMGLTRGQFFSTFMIVAGLAFILYGVIAGRKPVASQPG